LSLSSQQLSLLTPSSVWRSFIEFFAPPLPSVVHRDDRFLSSDSSRSCTPFHTADRIFFCFFFFSPDFFRETPFPSLPRGTSENAFVLFGPSFFHLHSPLPTSSIARVLKRLPPPFPDSIFSRQIVIPVKNESYHLLLFVPPFCSVLPKAPRGSLLKTHCLTLAGF